jgi:hypothetical protein
MAGCSPSSSFTGKPVAKEYVEQRERWERLAEEVAGQRKAGPEIDFPRSPAASRTRRARNASSSTEVELKSAKYKTPFPPLNVARR